MFTDKKEVERERERESEREIDKERERGKQRERERERDREREREFYLLIVNLMTNGAHVRHIAVSVLLWTLGPLR